MDGEYIYSLRREKKTGVHPAFEYVFLSLTHHRTVVELFWEPRKTCLRKRCFAMSQVLMASHDSFRVSRGAERHIVPAFPILLFNEVCENTERR